MNKEEFLRTLRKKLSILEESEIEDILNEYEGYIEEKISQGVSEEEAVKSMGNINELTRELLSAYKIKEPQDKTRDTINTIADGCMNIFDRVVDTFSHKSFQEILRFVIEIVFIFIIIAICKIPFEILESMGRNAVATIFSGSALRVIANIWNFILEFAYLIFAVLFFIKIFENRYLEEFKDYHKKAEKEINEEPIEEGNKKKEKRNNESIVKQSLEKEKSTNQGIISIFTNVCLFFIKMIVFCILLGVIFYLVGMSVTLGLVIYLLCKGVFYFGIYIILFALFILGIVAFIALYNFIFNRKNKVSLLLLFSLASFILLGLGVGVCTIEFANTTVFYNHQENDLKIESFTYDMKDNFLFAWNLEGYTNVHIDESLGKKIKLEYTYNDQYYNLVFNPSVHKNKEFEILYPNYQLNEFKYSKELFDQFIDDLKHKTIHVYDHGGVKIHLYMTSKVYEELNQNYTNFRKKIENDEYDVYDYEYYYGYHLPGYHHYQNM